MPLDIGIRVRSIAHLVDLDLSQPEVLRARQVSLSDTIDLFWHLPDAIYDPPAAIVVQVCLVGDAEAAGGCGCQEIPIVVHLRVLTLLRYLVRLVLRGELEEE